MAHDHQRMPGRCILDDNRTNRAILSADDDRIPGFTLCDRTAPLEQRTPQAEPTFTGVGSLNPRVFRIYTGAMRIENWLSHARAVNVARLCPGCAAELRRLIDGAIAPAEAR